MEQNNSFFSTIRKDVTAGLIVFLIALPLCLGIAQASEAPLFSGIVAGIIGGIIVGILSGSQLSVVGPAAGLTAIVITAIGDLGAFDIFLCAVIAAGFFQLILGFLRAGSIANYFPTSVIEGMLAGIGLTIIIKQIPEAIGYSSQNIASSPDAGDSFSFSSIGNALTHVQSGAIIISVIGLAILVLWQTKAFKKLSIIPSGLLVVVLGTLINEALLMSGTGLGLGQSLLVNLPVPSSASEFIGQFTTPDLQGFLNPAVWTNGLIIAVVASIETLLCIEATDKLDPQKRVTPTNRELKAQGIGNMISGLVGGLPMTSVIVRSSANINAGAQTKRSAIFHGILLLVCAASIPVLLNKIPKASLAVILIYTGYRLCNPKVFRHIWKEGGYSQFIPFVATAVSVVALDLLMGVGIGIMISIFYLLKKNMSVPFFYSRNTFNNGDLIKLTLAQEVSFLNKASIKETLNKLPENSSVIIDATQTEYIDYDVLDLIRDFQVSQAPRKNIKLSLLGFKDIYKVPPTSTEREVISGFIDAQVIKSRTSGNYKDLIKQLDHTEN